MPKKTSPSKSLKNPSTSDIRTLKAELYVLKMKHSMRELKEVHKIKAARREIARHLTKLHNS